MASIDFDPEDYIEEISTEDLVEELKRRAKNPKGDKAANEALRQYSYGFPLPHGFYDVDDLREAIKLGDPTHLDIVINGLVVTH